MHPNSEQHKRGFDIKTDFLYGLFVILPVVVTIWVIKVTIRVLSGPISWVFGERLPILLSLLITLLIVIAVGLLARNIIGKILIDSFERMMEKIPIVSILYRSIKQVIHSFSFNNKNFLDVILVEYPRPGIYALGYITKKKVIGVRDRNGENPLKDMSAVFIPTTPNPTSGYFLYVKTSELIQVNISIEDSVKIVMSAGVLGPEEVDTEEPLS